MIVADLIFDYLAEIGVEHIFLLPGGGNMYLIDAVARNPKLHAVPMLHEQSVGIAADAYAQFRNNLGVALVTTGPGATNAITACAASWADSIPVLFISGQVKQSDSAEKYGVRQLGFQETPISKIVAPITKKVVKLENAMDAAKVIHDLCKLAIEGRPGPVWLDVPLNIQSSKTVKSASFKRTSTKSELEWSGPVLDLLLSDWLAAKRPVLLLGNGIRSANAISIAQKFINTVKTPALLTWKAMDLIPESHQFNAGRPGAIAQRWANFAQQDSDFLLAIGARLDTGQTAYRVDNFAPHAKKYIVDIDSNELGKLPNANWTKINIDANAFLNVILKEIDSKIPGRLDFSNWMNQISKWKTEFPLINEKNSVYTDGLSIYHLVDQLSNFMNSDDVFAPGSSGACSEVSMQAFRVKNGQRVLNSEALGPMGFGIPGAIGACFASGKHRTFCIDGDGGFMMNIQDLATVAINHLPIIFFILNNNGYGSIKSSQDSYFAGRRLGTDPSNGLGMPNFKILSKSFGIRYLCASDNNELKNVFTEISKSRDPMIVEVFISEMQKTSPRVTSYLDKDGSLRTSPMEDMSPLLDIEQLKDIFVNNLSSEILTRER